MTWVFTSVFLAPSGHDWIMVSSCYVKTDGDVAGWRELLSRLGVRDGLIIRKERVTLTAEELVRALHMCFSAVCRLHKNAITCYQMNQGHLGAEVLMASSF